MGRGPAADLPGRRDHHPPRLPSDRPAQGRDPGSGSDPPAGSPLITLTEPRPGDERTATLRRLTWLLDDCIRLPVGFRIGLDAIIGLFPGLGDAIGAAAALYGISVAWRLGAPGIVVARMVLNASVDALFGAIPLLGDLWDAGFASHRRNLAILEHWLAEPHIAARRSKWVLIGAIASLLVVLLAALGFAIWIVVWVAKLLSR